MDGDRKPCLTRPKSWNSATAQQCSQYTSYPFASVKQENLDSNVLDASAQPDLLPSFTNEFMSYQMENSRSASSLEYSPCLEVYNPGSNNIEGDYSGQGVVSVSDPVVDQNSPLDGSSRPIYSSRRVLPAVGAFTVQCARCLKWRLIPTKEQYEAIRQCILEDPWVCENARLWRPNASCDDPADLSQDRSQLWAIDKPNISQPPPGWERLLVFRAEGASKFADVYYVTPSGKKLRSMVEVERFLLENPEYLRAGVNLSQFSYQIPKPLYEGYVRKRPPGGISESDMGRMKKINTISKIEKDKKVTKVNPLSRRKAVGSSNLVMDSSLLQTAYINGANYDHTMQSELWGPFFPPFTKKKRSSRMRPKRLATLWNPCPQ